jgi:hypothetical protein
MKGADMYALFVEVNADESQTDMAREYLNGVVVPGARQAGAQGGHWLAPFDGRGVSIVTYETEEAARAVADRFTVGERPPSPDAPEGVTVRTVEVREVLASI